MFEPLKVYCICRCLYIMSVRLLSGSLPVWSILTHDSHDNRVRLACSTHCPFSAAPPMITATSLYNHVRRSPKRRGNAADVVRTFLQPKNQRHLNYLKPEFLPLPICIYSMFTFYSINMIQAPMYGNDGHLGHMTQFSCGNFHSHSPISFHMKIGFK